MFISRIPLNTARFGARQLIASPYRMHAAVEKSFPPDSARENDEGRILWRLDESGRDHSVWLYVVSPEQPDFTHIVEQAGWPLHSEWESKDYDVLLNRIAVGQRWRFKLKANPVRQAKTDNGRRSRVPSENIIGKRQGHVTVGQQTNWLLSRAGSHGFSVIGVAGEPDVVVKQRRTERFEHGDGKVTLTTAVYEGSLEITEAGLFKTALCRGIGRGKGFGCGLLTIAPIKDM